MIAATAAVNIKIKFAPDAATATRAVVALGLRIGSWLVTATLVLELYLTVMSPEPVTRFVVFQIAMSIATLLLGLVYLGFKSLANAVLQTSKLLFRHTEVTERIVGVIERQVGDPPSGE